jgi:hypothetical protein
VAAAANEGAARTTTITFTGGGVVQTVSLTQEDPTGNESVEATPEIWYSNGLLSVRTAASEAVTVYSLSGVAVFRAEKDAGRATFRLNDLPGGVYIVRGGSGWARKFAVQH